MLVRNNMILVRRKNIGQWLQNQNEHKKNARVDEVEF